MRDKATLHTEEHNVAFGWSLIMESVGHELGHVYGLKHAPCGGPDDTDDNFVPKNGQADEVGVDPVGQAAFAPKVGDIMSYGANRSQPDEGEWMSVYDWTKLFLKFRGI
jgi:hypothetical protein